MNRSDIDIEDFFCSQLANWNLAKNNFLALESVETKAILVDGFEFLVQFNPARAVSSTADLSKSVISKRPCFLCAHNRPKEQNSIDILENYSLLVNPFPILKRHFTIAENQHISQGILNRVVDFLRLTTILPRYLLFYNGAKSGASAPDHHHFQACCRGVLPLENSWKKNIFVQKEISEQTTVFISKIPYCAIVIKGEKVSEMIDVFHKIISFLPQYSTDFEPMMNLFSWKDGDEYFLSIIPRKSHRPNCYFSKNEDEKLLVSPGAVDVSGMMIVVREPDFQRINSQILHDVFQEVCFTAEEITTNFLRSVFSK